MITFKEYLTEANISNSVRQRMKELGYKLLGSGVDQAAFLEPKTGKVLKIFGRGSSRSHGMFEFWANYCKQHASNPFLPKFDGWEKFQHANAAGTNGEYIQIRMEKLQKLPEGLGETLAGMSHAADESEGLDAKIRAKNKAALESLVGGSGEIRKLGSAFYGVNKDEVSKLAILLGRKKFNLLWDTLCDMSDLAEKHGWYLDLHSDNFMHRNDGIPVIVDPWVVSSDFLW